MFNSSVKIVCNCTIQKSMIITLIHCIHCIEKHSIKLITCKFIRQQAYLQKTCNFRTHTMLVKLLSAWLIDSSIWIDFSLIKTLFCQELCQSNGLWLHLEGHALSALTLLPTTTNYIHGDSMTLTFGSWIGIPAVPFVTLYKNKAELEMEFFEWKW